MPISNIVYLNRIQTAKSRKQLRSRPTRIQVQVEEELNLKEFLDTIKGKTERQNKLSQY